MGFEKTVSAALAETQSKFDLAEALALEIPAYADVKYRLAQARQAIIDAGGEPRDTGTLATYRKVALWVQDGEKFRWVPGRSWSVHVEACNVGMGYETFVALPKPTVDTIRALAGKAGTDGQPEKIARAWTTEQKAAAVREILASPEVAKEVFADSDIAGDAVRHAYPQLARAMHEEDRRKWNRAVPPGSDEERTREREQQAYEVLEVMQRMHQLITSTGRLAGLGTLSELQVEMIVPLAERTKVAVEFLTALSTGNVSLDDELATILEGEI